MYISISLEPGYDPDRLAEFGFGGEYNLFQGNIVTDNQTTVISWNHQYHSIKGESYDKYKFIYSSLLRYLGSKQVRYNKCI